MQNYEQAAKAHDVYVKSDSSYQRRLRLAQALWRETQALPAPTEGPSRGSRLAPEAAEQDLANYLTDTIRDVLRAELADAKAHGKLFSTPRIYDNLLSSQPLCFNLFGELAADPALATEVCRLVWPERVAQVERICFEHSPGRGDERYLGNRTAFDVYIEHTTPDGGNAFIGIEVKYHEDLSGSAAAMRPRLLEVAESSGLFPPEPADTELGTQPLQQIWFDHLLALSMLQADTWDDGLFVFLAPAANVACNRAARRYASMLTDRSTIETRTLEEVVGALRWTTADPWVEAFADRYLEPPVLG